MRPFWISAPIALFCSLVAKWVADAFLTERVEVLGSLLALRPSQNPGIAFGFTFHPWVQTAIILTAVCLVLYLALSAPRSPLVQTGFGLIVGGAFGNILDRLLDGSVTDFFQVGGFPIFNVADSFITIGVWLLLLDYVLENYRRTKNR